MNLEDYKKKLKRRKIKREVKRYGNIKGGFLKSVQREHGKEYLNDNAIIIELQKDRSPQLKFYTKFQYFKSSDQIIIEIQNIKDKIIKAAKRKDGLSAKTNNIKNTVHRIQCPTKLLLKDKEETYKIQR